MPFEGIFVRCFQHQLLLDKNRPLQQQDGIDVAAEDVVTGGCCILLFTDIYHFSVFFSSSITAIYLSHLFFIFSF